MRQWQDHAELLPRSVMAPGVPFLLRGLSQSPITQSWNLKAMRNSFLFQFPHSNECPEVQEMVTTSSHSSCPSRLSVLWASSGTLMSSHPAWPALHCSKAALAHSCRQSELKHLTMTFRAFPQRTPTQLSPFLTHWETFIEHLCWVLGRGAKQLRHGSCFKERTRIHQYKQRRTERTC